MSLGTGRSIPITSTGNVEAADGFLLSAHLAAGAGAAATLTLRSGGAGGTIITTLAAITAGGDSRQYTDGVPYVNPLHATLGGAGASADVEVG